MQLTQKETSLLKDLKDQEKICVEKYSKYADICHDMQLKNLFTTIANAEKQHLETVSQIENGGTPSTSNGGSNKTTPTFSEHYGIGNTPEKQADAYLCSDLLADEKHVSSLYNTSIFEFSQTVLRDALNHIQKEEQTHGKMIYDYMSVNNMYS